MTVTTDSLLDVSLGSQLRQVRGVVERSTTGYPENVHVHVRDAAGGLWKFVSWHADWSPDDPERFQGQAVEDIRLDATGRLVWRFSGRETLTVVPRVPQESPDDPSYWELLTPDGLSVEFGPGALVRVQSASSA